MGCNLELAGRQLDVDALSAALKWSGWRIGYPEPLLEGEMVEGRHYASLRRSIASASGENFPRQVAQATAWLKQREKKLSLLKDWPQLEFASLRFLAFPKSSRKDYFTQHFYLPAETIALAGRLGLEVDIWLVN